MTKTVTVSAGSNLFQIAAQYLNDGTQWIRIAIQNGLYDPMLPPAYQMLMLADGSIAMDAAGNVLLTPPTYNLTIPDVNLTLGGGLPPQ
jgi:hypothetical protein